MNFITDEDDQITTVNFNKKELKGIKRTLEKIYAVLKPKKNWIKGSYMEPVYEEDQDDVGHYGYCLVGAAQEVDGEHEDMASVFAWLHPPTGWEFKKLTCCKDLDDLAGIAGEADGEIIDFNDHKSTEHKHVTAWLRSLIKKADKMIRK